MGLIGKFSASVCVRECEQVSIRLMFYFQAALIIPGDILRLPNDSWATLQRTAMTLSAAGGTQYSI